MANFKFKIGDRVSYSILEKIWFTGTIAGIDTNKENKPYIIYGDDGKDYYASADQLKVSDLEVIMLPSVGKTFAFDGENMLVNGQKCDVLNELMHISADDMLLIYQVFKIDIEELFFVNA